MNYINNMLEAIGNTPLLKLNKIGKDVPANVFVKPEYLNPSGSYKGRMAPIPANWRGWWKPATRPFRPCRRLPVLRHGRLGWRTIWARLRRAKSPPSFSNRIQTTTVEMK